MKLYRKLLSALFAAMLILGLFSALPTFAEDNPQEPNVAVTVTIDKTSVAAGGDVTLSFKFDQAVQNVSSFSFYVGYDTSLFTYDIEKSKMPDDYYANCNQNPYTIAYTETTPQTNLAKFGFGHVSTVAAAFNGTDNYAAGEFYQMVFTAKNDITDDVTATFNLNHNGTQMLTYSFKEDGSLDIINNQAALTVNSVTAGEGGEANSIDVTVKGPAWDDTTADWSWYNTTATEFTITTPAQLAGLAAIVNGTAKDLTTGEAIKDSFAGKTIELGSNIDLENWNWTPIGRRTGDTTYDSFAGTFEGKGYTITNLSITYDVTNQLKADGTALDAVGSVGLFGNVMGTDSSRAVIKNLTLDGKVTIMVGNGPEPGTLAGFGGLVGRTEYSDYSNCIVDVDIQENVSKINQKVVKGLGGIIGLAENIKIENCANLGKVEAVRASRVGGIIGLINNTPAEIKDCYNRGDVSATEQGTAGGIIGEASNKKNTTTTISNCYNTGTIIGSSSGAPGAVFGKINFKGTVTAENLYYLESSCTKAIGSGKGIDTTSKTADEMQAGCFVDLLNSNHVWKQGSTYPILTCQADEEPGPAHALQHVEAKEATCAEEGNQEYWKCSVCEKLFSDAEGKTEITTVPVIAKLDHTLVKTEAKDATCLAEGNRAYWTCSACGKLFFDENGTTETTAEAVVIAKLAHTLVKTEAKDATCTEAGNIEYWTCSECERLFSDDTGTKEVNTEDTVIAALDHDWGDWKTITPATDASEGAEERECSRCHMKETQSIPPLTHIHGLEHINAVSASCTEPGNIEYWQCNTSAGDGMTPCHRYFADEAGTTEINAEDTVVKALGHDFGEWSLKTPATCKTPGVETRVCSRDAVEETRETGINPNAHEYGEGVVTTEPTCTGKGVMTYTCIYDDTHTRTEDIDALDHDYQAVEESAQEPTCTKAGKKADQKCSRCGDVITGEEIPAQGHTWGEWEVTTEATCKEKGEETHICSVCGEEETREVDLKDHTWDEGEVITPATTDSKGEMLYTCTVCGETKQEEIPEIDYVFTNSEKDFQFEEGSEKLVLTVKRTVDDGKTYEHFIGVAMDGKEVAKDNYTAEPGSVVITFKADYVKALTPGEHKVTVLFDDDTVEHKLTVVEKKDETSSDTAPKTGDTNNTSTWIIIMAVALALLVGCGIFAIRKKVK